MKLLLDTCTWLKVQSLQRANIFDFRPIFYRSDLWTTHELMKEYKIFLADFLDFSKLSILAVDLTFIRHFVGEPLDEADLSLIEFGRRNSEALIISDDGEALSNCYLFNSKSFQLADFSLYLTVQSVITKRETYHIIQSLREWKNIRKNHHRKLQEKLQEIR